VFDTGMDRNRGAGIVGDRTVWNGRTGTEGSALGWRGSDWIAGDCKG
jgi:hypothetical protein